MITCWPFWCAWGCVAVLPQALYLPDAGRLLYRDKNRIIESELSAASVKVLENLGFEVWVGTKCGAAE